MRPARGFTRCATFRGEFMDRIKIIGGQQAQRHHPDLGRQERGLAADDRQPADRRPADAEERAQSRRRQSAGAHSAQSRRRSCGRRQAAGPPMHLGETFHLTARDIVDTTAPYEMVSRMRASFWVLGPLLARMRRGQGFAAGRLRHRHAAGRSASDGPEGARRRDRDRRRLRARQGAQGPARRAHRVPEGVGRRHAQRAAGGRAGQGRDA